MRSTNVRLTRLSRYGKTVYVEGTYKAIPAAMLKYRSKFRQVGRNVFIVDKPGTTRDKLLKSDLKLADLVAKHGPTAKLGDVLRVQTQAKYRRATEAEVAVYKAARLRLETYVQAVKAKVVAENKRKAQRALARAQADLERAKTRYNFAAAKASKATLAASASA